MELPSGLSEPANKQSETPGEEIKTNLPLSPEGGISYSQFANYVKALDDEAMRALGPKTPTGSDEEAKVFYARLRELASEKTLFPENASEEQKDLLTAQILQNILQKVGDQRVSSNDLGVVEVLMEEYEVDFVGRLPSSMLVSMGIAAAWSREMDESKANTKIISILKDKYAKLLLIGLIQDKGLYSLGEVFLEEHGSDSSGVGGLRVLEALRQLVNSTLPYKYPLEFEDLLYDIDRFIGWAKPGCTGYLFEFALDNLRKAVILADDVLTGDLDPSRLEVYGQYRQNEEYLEDYPEYVPVFEELIAKHQKEYLFNSLSKDYIGVHTTEGKFAGALSIHDLEAKRLRFYHLDELNISSAENLKSDEEKNAMAFDMRTMLSVSYMQKMQEDLGIPYSELSLREINYLYAFIKNLLPDQVASLASDIAEFDIPLITTLLSTEHGPEMGLVVSKIARYLTHETAEKVFVKYAELVETADGVRGYLQDHYSKELAEKPGLEEEIIQNLLRKGKQILESASEGQNEEEILASLERNKGDVLLFANAFRRMYGREISLEQFKDLAIEHISGGSLSPEEYIQMLSISDQNWSEQRKLMPQMYTQIMHDVPSQLNGKNPETGEPTQTTWHILKHKDEVIGFFRLDDTAPDKVYFGSMNSRSDLHGYKVGDAILREMLLKTTEGKKVEAHSSPKTAICRSYINRYGFVGTGLIPYHETGEDVLAIGRESGTSYSLQGKSFSELEGLRGEGASVQEGCEIAEYALPTDFSGDEYQRFLKECQARFDKGLVMSAYVSDTMKYVIDPGTEHIIDQGLDKKNIRYLVAFEPAQSGFTP